jgi:hypothetical protein
MLFYTKIRSQFLAVNFVKLSIVFCKIDVQVIFKFYRLIILVHLQITVRKGFSQKIYPKGQQKPFSYIQKN